MENSQNHFAAFIRRWHSGCLAFVVASLSCSVNINQFVYYCRWIIVLIMFGSFCMKIHVDTCGVCFLLLLNMRGLCKLFNCGSVAYNFFLAFFHSPLCALTRAIYSIFLFFLAKKFIVQLTQQFSLTDLRRLFSIFSFALAFLLRWRKNRPNLSCCLCVSIKCFECERQYKSSL